MTSTQLMYAHGEAFCLMQYDADDGSETEVIWNSRDGVTPFLVHLRSGKPATHARWGEDVRASERMARALGVRWFIDMTPELARPGAIELVDKNWDHPEYPMSRMWPTKDEAVEALVRDWVGDGHSPTLVDAPGAAS